ncbi:hypothetical protein [Micromonospora sp. CPCC 206061]|uniref:hypothetical protein n=1 Tax=Micromonospora sp. CPCC 206061 TaxID=3122410 RepID=UPI002FEED694
MGAVLAINQGIDVQLRGVMMGLRAYRRSQGIQGHRRKVIGAVVVSGVLVAAGIGGVQLASATTTPKAADLITVNGQQFDVSQCEQLEINGEEVICDGAELAPEQEQDANEAALASAQALEASCDEFAADVQAVEDGQAAEDEQAAEEEAAEEEQTAEEARAERKLLAKKWSAAMDAAEEKQNAAGENAAGENAAGENAEDENGQNEEAAAEAVTSAQATLLQACLALADAKEAAGVADNGADQQGAEEANGADENAEEQDAEAKTTE